MIAIYYHKSNCLSLTTILTHRDNRDLNYDKFVVKGEVHTMSDESYTSHNTERLDVEGTVKKILTTDYVQEALKELQR